jgi:predicted MPP superfamily phosphohydrolase
VALAALVLLTGYMALEADMVHVEYADVYLSGLPAAFDGTRVLFLSDLHVSNLCTPEKAAALVNQLQALKPDLVLLGGDYSSLDIEDYGRALTGGLQLPEAKKALGEKRDQFFRLISSFEAPIGKYAVPGNHDYELLGLDQAAELGGFTLLKNNGKVLTRNGQHLIVAGLDDWRSGEQDIKKIASSVRGSDFVILLSHNPDALPSVISQPGADGQPWADLVLSGHTHGGQIALFGHGLFSASIYGDRYRSGWYEDGASMLLVSNGVGDYMLPLRLGASPQVHLITLYKK